MNYEFQERVEVKELPTGDKLSVVRHQIQGNTPGPAVYIQANVHGAEVQGNAVVYHLMDFFQNNDFSGTINFVPQANPIGIIHKIGAYTYGRFSASTGENFNRTYLCLDGFPLEQHGLDYEEFVREHGELEWEVIQDNFKRMLRQSLEHFQRVQRLSYGLSENHLVALELQKWASSADIVLDLHTGPDACDYLYIPEMFLEDAKKFFWPVNLLFDGVFAGAADEATLHPWLKLQQVFKVHGRDLPLDFRSFTVELGSEEKLDIELAKQQAFRILSFLAHKGVVTQTDSLNNVLQIPQKRFVGHLNQYKTYYSPRGGVVDFRVKSGDYVEKGTTLAQFLSFKNMNKEEKHHSQIDEVKAKASGIVVNRYPSSNVPQGHQLFQFLEDAKELT